MKKLFIAPILGITGLVAPLNGATIVNGSFETGDFSGWIAADFPITNNPLVPLAVVPAGTFIYFGPSSPTDGNFSAIHGFDGGGPDTISFAQDIGVVDPSSSTLTFDYNFQWEVFTSGSDRIFNVNILPAGGGIPLGTFEIVSADYSSFGSAGTGPSSASLDLAAYVGTDVRLSFDSFIPDFYTGPGQADIDNIRLSPGGGGSTIPEPSSTLALCGLLLTGLAFRKR